MTTYLALKSLHVGCVALSLGGFVLRGLWMTWWPERLGRRWVRVVPHIVDTVLLASGVSLAVLLQLNPLASPWLGAKLGALIVYILLGTVALRRGRTRGVRITAWWAALLTFAYMLAVARTHSPLPWQFL